jgi:hypothetical protein
MGCRVLTSVERLNSLVNQTRSHADPGSSIAALLVSLP